VTAIISIVSVTLSGGHRPVPQRPRPAFRYLQRPGAVSHKSKIYWGRSKPSESPLSAS